MTDHKSHCLTSEQRFPGSEDSQAREEKGADILESGSKEADTLASCSKNVPAFHR